VATVTPLKEFQLLDICDFYSGKAHEQHITENGKFKVINSKFVATEGEVYKTSSESFLTAKKNDITMVMSDLPNGRALAKCFFVDKDDKYAVNQRVCILRAKSFDPKYLFYVLNRHNYFLSFNDGVSQTHLLNHVFEKCKIVISDDIDEQKAIAEALSDIDKLIEIQKWEIGKLKKVLKGQQDEIFSESNLSSWELREIGNIGRLFTASRKQSNGVPSSRFVILDMGSVSENGLVIASKFTNASDDELSFGSLVIPKDDIGGGKIIGKAFCVDQNHRYVLGDHVFGLRVNDDYDPFFVRYALNYSESNARIMKMVGGSAQLGLPKSSFIKHELRFPKKNIQLEFSSTLQATEFTISSAEELLFKYEWLKQGMMNDLLTGKVRLV
jgi:type I restriction enzyme S subunit